MKTHLQSTFQVTISCPKHKGETVLPMREKVENFYKSTILNATFSGLRSKIWTKTNTAFAHASSGTHQRVDVPC